jgi:hypothetical protein
VTEGGPAPKSVVRTETDSGVAWLFTQVSPAGTDVTWVWLVGLGGVPLALVLVDPVVALGLAITWFAGAVFLSVVAGGVPVRRAVRVVLNRRGVTSATVGELLSEPTNALEGVALHRTTVTWDDLQQIEVEGGQLALLRADGSRLLLPWFPEPTTAEIVGRIREFHEAFEQATTPRDAAEAAQRRLASLLRDREGD